MIDTVSENLLILPSMSEEQKEFIRKENLKAQEQLAKLRANEAKLRREFQSRFGTINTDREPR